MSPTITYGIVCDLIRREDSGKLLLVGVYGRNIAVMSFPATLPIYCMFRLENVEAKEYKIKIRTKYADNITAEVEGRMNIKEKGVAIHAFGPLIVSDINNPGELVVEIKFDDDEWQIGMSIPVELRKSNQTIASPPPA